MVKQAIQFGLAAAMFAALFAPEAQSQAKTKAAPAKKSAPKMKAKAAPKAAAPKVAPGEFVTRSLERGLSIPVDNPAALVPFFEQLYRHQRGELPGPVRVLQYGDSHTAADELSGGLRVGAQSALLLAPLSALALLIAWSAGLAAL